MAKSKLDMFTKKMIKMMSLKTKKIMFLMKPKNLYKVIILLAILLVLYFIHQKFLVKVYACTAKILNQILMEESSCIISRRLVWSL